MRTTPPLPDGTCAAGACRTMPEHFCRTCKRWYCQLHVHHANHSGEADNRQAASPQWPRP
jgi:hypothetical protein